MSLDPEIVSWLKIVAGSSVTGTVLIALAKWFVVRPLEKAEQEAKEYKDLWKEEQRARVKRIEAAEAALGRPSMRPHRENQTTRSMLVETMSRRQYEEELQRQMLAERAVTLPHAPPLEAFEPTREPELHGLGGRQDYEDHRKRNARDGVDTPIDFKPKGTRR